MDPTAIRAMRRRAISRRPTIFGTGDARSRQDLPGLVAAALRAADRGAHLGAEGGAAAAAVQRAVVGPAGVAQSVLVGERLGGRGDGLAGVRRAAARGAVAVGFGGM